MLEIVLDFETYYSKKDKYSLAAKGMTYEKYIRDSRFEVLGLAVKVGEDPTKWLCPHEIEDWLKEIESQYGWKNVRLIMHNGRFDAAILGWVYNIYPGEIADTMLMSRASQLWDSHSLGNVTEQLVQRNWGCYIDMAGNLYAGDLGEDRSRVEDYLLHKGKEILDADGKHLMSFTDEEYEAFAAYGMNDVDLTYSAYRWFMDVRKFPEAEIGVMTYTIEMFTYPVLKLDDKVLTVVQEEINYKRNTLLAKAGATLEDLRSDVKFAEMLRNLGVEPPTKINKKGEVKFAFAKKDLNFLALLDHENQDVVDLVNARLGNKSSQAVTRVQSFLELSARGMLPVPIEYYAAHTGRWGGSDGINMQNINRNTLVTNDTKFGTYVFYDKKADRVVNVNQGGKVYLAKHGLVDNDEELLHQFGLRDSFLAPKGKTLVCFDLSQVELRMNSWLWKEMWILDALTSGKDIYKVTAAGTYQVPYEEVTKSQRFVGKSQQLGLGYGAGVNGLKVVMGKRSEEFTDDQLQSFVDSYRKNAPNIRDGWKSCTRALDAMMSGQEMYVDAQGVTYTQGHKIILPNGLGLTYRDIHIQQGVNFGSEYVFWGKDKVTKKPGWEKTFGGKIDENLCQALCRIVLSEQMANIKQDFIDRGWSRDDAHICMQVHDEVITCCREDIAEDVAKIMKQRMKESPQWCKTLPLDCDGDIARRYGCAK